MRPKDLIQHSVRLDRDISLTLEILFWDPATLRMKYGSFNGLIMKLLNLWLRNIRKGRKTVYQIPPADEIKTIEQVNEIRATLLTEDKDKITLEHMAAAVRILRDERAKSTGVKTSKPSVAGGKPPKEKKDILAALADDLGL